MKQRVENFYREGHASSQAFNVDRVSYSNFSKQNTPRIQSSTVSLKTSSFRAFSEKILITCCFETIAWKFFDECRFSFNLIEKQFS